MRSFFNFIFLKTYSTAFLYSDAPVWCLFLYSWALCILIYDKLLWFMVIGIIINFIFQAGVLFLLRPVLRRRGKYDSVWNDRTLNIIINSHFWYQHYSLIKRFSPKRISLIIKIKMSRAMWKCVISYANNKDADLPAHPRSLISAFVVRCLDSIISLDSIAEISWL